MPKRVEAILRKHGPMLSGAVAVLLEQEYGVSNTAARQALSRAKKPINKICTLSFQNNQKFFYLEEQYMSNAYCGGLLQAIQESSQVNWIYLSAFFAQEGYVTKELLPALVSSPVGRVKGHKSHDRVIQDLLKCGLIEEFDGRRWKLCDWVGHWDLPRSMGLETVKKQLARDFGSWAAKLNLAAYNSVKTLDTPADAQFGNFQWALTAPSYVRPLYNDKQNAPGFLIADVFCGKKASVEDITFFINKVDILRSFRSIKPFLPVFLADRLEPEALKLLKEKKVLVGLTENLFGRQYAQLLAEIVAIFSNAGAILAKNPDRVEALFSEISKAEGRYNDMVGDMFELLAGYYYHAIGCRDIFIGKQIRDPETGRRNELDVLAFREGGAVVVECKAMRSAIDVDFVETWLGKNIPQTFRWLRERYPDSSSPTFQLWSLGGFTAEAQGKLSEAAGKIKKYNIEYFNQQEILGMARSKHVQPVVDILTQHFRR